MLSLACYHPYSAKIKVTTKFLSREAAHGDHTEVTSTRYWHAKTIRVPQKGSQRHTYSSSSLSNKSSNSSYSNSSRAQFTQATTALRSLGALTEHAQSISLSSRIKGRSIEFPSSSFFQKRSMERAPRSWSPSYYFLPREVFSAFFSRTNTA